MKFRILTLCLILTSCSTSLKKITEEQIDHIYAGRITVSEPTKSKKGIELNLTFSGGGWIRNSGVCFKKAKAEVNEKTIRMRVFTSVCTGESVHPKLILSDNLEGSYQLVFEDPDGTIHPLTTIEIP
jgi:hypothetical protein